MTMAKHDAASTTPTDVRFKYPRKNPIVHEMLVQLGGLYRLVAKLGAHDWRSTERSFGFSFTASTRADRARIALAWDDTYTLELWQGEAQVKAVHGLYCDNLVAALEHYTGTKLGA
jgi:hypothetical protein